MNCKHCQAGLEEGSTICPVCGKNNAEEQTVVEEIMLQATEETVEEAAVEETSEDTAEEVDSVEMKEDTPDPTQKPKKGKIVLAVAACVVLLAVLASFIWYGVNGSFMPRENNLLYRESYSVDEDTAQTKGDVVIAAVGEETLSNAELQIYYWMNVYDFLNSYGSYAYYMGMDYTVQLDVQYVKDGTTWQHYFLDMALNEWHRYQALCLEGQAAGYEMSEEMRAQIDSLPETMEQTALENGYEDAEQMLREEMGPGATLAGYMDYLETYYYGSEYFDTKYQELSPTQDDVQAYYDLHKEEYLAEGLSQETKIVDVRHILITPEGGTTDETGTTTYSDEEWENCRIAAQAILDEWAAGTGTEESFAVLAGEHSTDPGSNTNGGLYSGVTQGQMVEAFDAWCFDESRAFGDTGLVKTNYGYHIMYFVGSGLSSEWFSTAYTDLMTERVQACVEEIEAKYPLEIDFKKIVLGVMDFSTTG